MKKLFLLLAAGSCALYANAQQNNSIVLSHAENKGKLNAHVLTGNHNHSKVSQSGTTSRTTSVPVSQWYDLFDQNYVDGISVNYYFEVSPDSNIYDASIPDFIFDHGMGMSFDPTDSGYSYLAQTTSNATMPSTGQTYTVDSFYVNGRYIRNNPSSTVVDSLIIEFMVSAANYTPTDSGTYNLEFNTPTASCLPICYDETPRFSDCWYDTATNDGYAHVMAQKERVAIVLDSAFRVDTDANGDNFVQIALPTALTLKSDQHVISYVTFVSGVKYAFNTPTTSANYYWLFAGEPYGADIWQMQSSSNSAISYPGSYQDGLVSTSQIKYNDTGFAFNGHDILVPSYAYAGNTPNTPPGFDVPIQAFHVTYNDATGVTNVNKVISSVSAFPIPANGTLNIPFTLSIAGDATVTLSNALGQVVGSQTVSNVVNGKVVFNTTTLSAGVYVYTINANNARANGQVVIVH